MTEGPASLTTLLGAAEQGDRQAWGEIVERFTNLLWSVPRAHRLSDDESLDVVQTTWLRLVENLGRIHEPERLAGWLATTARRECLRVLRHQGCEDVGWADASVPEAVDVGGAGEGSGRGPVWPSATVEVDAALLDSERDAALWRCFARLSERCQRLLRVLMATEAPAYAEVSDALGLPIGSIGPTRMRCLARLRELADHGDHGSLTTNGGST